MWRHSGDETLPIVTLREFCKSRYSGEPMELPLSSEQAQSLQPDHATNATFPSPVSADELDGLRRFCEALEVVAQRLQSEGYTFRDGTIAPPTTGGASPNSHY